MTVVYLDRVVLLNLAVDYLLLLATARLAGLPLRRRRLGLCAALGAAYAAAVFLPGCRELAHPLCRLAAGTAMCRLAWRRERHPWRLTALFFLLSGALAGLLLAMGLAAGSPEALLSRVYHADVSWPVLLGSAMAGVLCLWSGVMEIMSRCGLSGKLAALLRPALRRLLPRASRDPETLAAVSANVSANLLGLGNAATPLGIRAARRMARGTDGTADDELCRLVVLNTASLQLLPTTVAGVRAACGCRTPFDILPAVWLSSAISVTAGLLAARLLQRVWRD